MAALDLETPRLRLAPFRTDEAGLLHQLWMEPGVRRHLWDGQVIPPEQTAEIVAKSEELFRRHGYGLWSLRLRRSREKADLLGFAGYWFFRDPPELEFIFGVAPAAWGQGLAVEAGRELLRYAFEDLGFSEVRASTDAANRASVRALEKLGMPFERRSTIQGLDTLFYSLRREDWAGGLKPLAPILTADRFPALGRELIALLRSLSDDQWRLPTVAAQWTVKDVAAHLLDTACRRLSSQRDGFMPPPDRPLDSYENLVAFLNDLNAQWVTACRRLSPRLLTDFLELVEPRYADLVLTLDPWAPALPVAWAGEEESLGWFDLARELTERWHHQQQIRLAVGAPPLDDPWFSEPVFDTFIRALPHGYRNVTDPKGTMLAVRIEGRKVYAYTIQAREGGGWDLLSGETADPAARIVLAEEPAWLLFTKGLRGEAAKRRATMEGDEALAGRFFEILAVMA